MLLERILLQEKVLELFTAFSRPTGGYIVPAGKFPPVFEHSTHQLTFSSQVYHNYAGTSFTFVPFDDVFSYIVIYPYDKLFSESKIVRHIEQISAHDGIARAKGSTV
jgi:hypothetical protein